ncbi:hypothetical protein GCM10010252_53660 [Streptomyces aureoverticillatus]|nr:hypothetical protein GCM10010252_53660 [Streptomyces aureoverticillatus]
MAVTPQERFADWLVQLRVAAGNPSYGELVAHNGTTSSGRLRGQLNPTGLSTLLNGKFVRPPRWEVVEAFVDACRAAARAKHGDITPDVARHLDRPASKPGTLWRERHAELVKLLGPQGAARSLAKPFAAATHGRDDRGTPDPRPFLESAPHDRYGATRSAFESYHSVILDREDELRRLLTAVRGPGAYHAIEAPAFAGKTALVVELYRRLRAQGCPTAVFYVVDRYAHRSQDFLEAVIGQLLAAVRSDESLGAHEERPAQFARLWTAFAALGTVERPAVLLVDGLDEQLKADGVSPLLPVRVCGHAHVVVATRSLPDFRAAVPRHHALAATPVDVVALDRSPHAEAKSDDARRHLEDWLSSPDPAPERIATLLRIAAAPLTRHDLADLLDLSVGHVARHLQGIERCLLPLALEVGGTGYQWAHITYGEFVEEWVGKARHAQEIQQVIAWAERHADRGWPDTTPPFLLHGLHHFVRAHRELVGGDRLVGLVTTARRQRLLETYGHESTFLETIALAREELRAADGRASRDLEVEFALDLHHLAATASTSGLPAGLLRLLVCTGQARQAEGIALSVEERYRADALAEVAEALADTGAGERAGELSDRAWKFASARTDRYWQLVALRACARAAKKTGRPMPRFVAADWLGDPDQRLFCACAEYLVEAGEPDAARSALTRLFAYEAEHGKLHTWVWAAAAAVLARLGDLDAATDLARKACEKTFLSLLGSNGSVPISQVVTGLVRADRVDDAIGIASQLTGQGDFLRASVHAALIDALVAEGRNVHADRILARELGQAQAQSHEAMRLVSLAYLSATQARGGDADVRFMRRLVRSVDAIEFPGSHLSDGLVQLGEGLLAAGDREGAARTARRALALSRRDSHPYFIDLLHDVTVASVDVGDLTGARRVADAITHQPWRSDSLRAVELAEAVAGPPAPADAYATWEPEDRAELAVAWAEAESGVARDLAHGLIEEWGQEERPRWQGHGILWSAVLCAVEVLHRTDGVEHCETALARVRPVARRVEALAKLSGCCRTTDEATADALLGRAIGMASRLRDRDTCLSALCAALTAAGPLRDRTEAVGRALAAFRRRAEPMTEAAGAGPRASMALALCRAGLDEAARVYAAEAYEITKNVGVEDDFVAQYRICDALVSVGMNDYALRVVEELDLSFALPDLVERCVAAGEMEAAGQLAERAVAVWEEVGEGEADVTERFVQALLRAGRVDLAEFLFHRFLEVSVELGDVARTFFSGLVGIGLADEALARARGLDSRYWRAAALVGWGTAPAWPPDVRRRNVRLLQEHVIGALPHEARLLAGEA